MNSLSDWKALNLLNEQGVDSLSHYHIYKACTALAINGHRSETEDQLNSEYQQLLQIRRLLKSMKLDQAMHECLNFQVHENHESYFELKGDQAFLLGHIFHRLNEPLKSEESFANATKWYSRGHDNHKKLRSLINKFIVIADIKSHISGDLYFLKQKAFSEKFFDLVANIAKAEANLWLHSGQIDQAERAAKEALELYQIDGCPEDRAISQCYVAISQYLQGKFTEFELSKQGIHIQTGKVLSYLNVLKSLSKNEIPYVTDGHPLYGMKWKLRSRIKENSIPGKILKILQNGAVGRDQLISEIWGEKAIDPSYNNRLYTAMNELRKKYHVNVNYDGEKYCLEEVRTA